MAFPQPWATKHVIKALQHMSSSHLILFPSLGGWINQKSGAENISIFPQTYTDVLAKRGDCLTESLEASVTQGSNLYNHEQAGQRGPSQHLAHLLGRLGRSPREKLSGAIHQGKQNACLCLW